MNARGVAYVADVLTWTQIGGFVVAALAIIIVPGPSVLFTISRGVALGWKAAVATVAGNTLGTSVHVAAVSIGVGALVARSAALFTAMKVVGAAYLIVLGVKAIRGSRGIHTAVQSAMAPKSLKRLVADGFVVGVSNPKTTLFFLAVLPQFVVRAHGHVPLQLLALGCIFLVLAFTSDSLYGLSAGGMKRWLERSPEHAGRLGVVSGLILIGLGIRVAVTGRAH
jgi:threonine/homoserine/homoserine lactone efflux protein